MTNEALGYELTEFMKDYMNSEEYKNKEKKEYSDYEFIPLTYKTKPEIEGFEVFSKETVYNEETAKIKKIDIDSPKHRYYHYEKIQQKQKANNKHIIYILFNPGKADPYTADNTIRNCRKLANFSHASEMSIINLFSERSGNSKYFDGTHIIENENNMKFINSFIKIKDNENKNNGNILFVKARGFGKSVNIKKIIEKLPEKTYIIGIKEEAIKMNHHPANWGLVGGIELAEIIEEE